VEILPCRWHRFGPCGMGPGLSAEVTALRGRVSQPGPARAASARPGRGRRSRRCPHHVFVRPPWDGWVTYPSGGDDTRVTPVPSAPAAPRAPARTRATPEYQGKSGLRVIPGGSGCTGTSPEPLISALSGPFLAVPGPAPAPRDTPAHRPHSAAARPGPQRPGGTRETLSAGGVSHPAAQCRRSHRRPRAPAARPRSAPPAHAPDPRIPAPLRFPPRQPPGTRR